MRLEDIITASDLQGYITAREYPAQVLETLFPPKKDDIVELAYVKGAAGEPVSASIRAVDAETQIGGRSGEGELIRLEIPTIARKIPLTEKFKLELAAAKDDRAVSALKRQIFNDLDSMVQGVRIRIERMRADALMNGKIEVNENGLVTEFDYKVPATHKFVVGTGSQKIAAWNASSNPGDWVKHLEDWVALLKTDRGITATRILTSSQVLRVVLSAAVTKTYIPNVGYITQAILNDWLASANLPTFATYDEMYAIEGNLTGISRERYIPEDKIALFGDGALGDTQFGVTAEEVTYRLDPSVQMSEHQYIIGAIAREFDPPVDWTKAAARALPSFVKADEVVQAVVLS